MKVGILGAGQLGQMLAQAAIDMGMTCRFLAPPGETCVEGLGDLTIGDLRDAAVLDRFAQGLDAVTYEWENVPVSAIDHLRRRVPVRPGPESLRIGQDRIQEKQFFRSCGLRVQAFAPVDAPRDFRMALQAVPLPAMLKTRRLGYDGKGQARVMDARDLAAAFEMLGGVPCILEAFVPFDAEISLVAVRGVEHDGTEMIRFWPAFRNEHREGILDRSVSPASGMDAATLHEAQRGVREALRRLDHQGVLCVEFFLADGELIANEMAPRVHNSAHGTMEGAVTSQFENHMRAVAHMPLGSTEPRGVTAMRNLVGSVAQPQAAMPPGTFLHLYGKQPRPRRKLGHVTSVAQREIDAIAACDAAFAALQGQPASARG
ncbi:MAG: 5-(carboxyamino)imidazole ribonucleotide synthase [Planctomycetes bacterium]|nr:5-(carboxyamino)imidazole ribonucleotide synthase [Planctomycetota bacterium]